VCLNAGVLAAEYFRLIDIGRPEPPIEWPYRTGPNFVLDVAAGSLHGP
jgi:hypothetical protein